MKPVHRRSPGILATWTRLALSLGLVVAVCPPVAATDPSAPATPYLELRQHYNLKGMGVGLDVAVSATGDVYLSSASRPGLWRLDGEAGRFVPINPYGAEKAAVRLFPEAISVDTQDRLWLADATLHQVYVLTREGEIVQRYGSPDLPLQTPATLSRLEGGGMVVWDKQTGELWTYSFPENRFSPQPLIPGLQCTANSPTVIYCVGEDNREIIKYQSGKIAARYDLKDDPYTRIGKIVLGPDQTIYLTDTGGKRLLSLTADLQLKHRFSLYEGLFIRPTRFAFSFNNSALWLIDEGREELLHFTLHSAVTGLEHGLLGEEYLALSQYEPALQELNTALQLGYRTPEIYLLLGQALYGLKRYSEALAAFSQTQGIGATPYFWQGNALFRLGRYEDALAAFQTALAREPDNEWVQFNMAQTLLTLNRFPQAETIFRTLVQRAPDNFQARLGLGRSLLSDANTTDAISVLTELVADKHVGREARHYLGLAYLQAGSSEQALPLLERAAREGPYFKQALSALADIYRRLGNAERAQFYEQQVRTLKQSMDPSDALPLKETL